MKKLFMITLVLTATVAMGQHAEKNPKDLWTRSINVTLGDDWRQKTITVPGKGIFRILRPWRFRMGFRPPSPSWARISGKKRAGIHMGCPRLPP